ncbi:autotransporter-associated beta strand repeat-containing protein, partial [Comamonas antarctica]|uniref:autotransporter-associated beta strand repeat-containing protein n=1 Tax=Comamonas antarctica TaxID=2743470 RepID=UPI0028E3D5F7
MNRIYRVVFNAVTGVWQAVSEVARGPGKSSRSARRLRRSALAAAAAGLLALASAPAYAACSPFAPPPGMTVTCSGSIYDYSATGADLTFNIAAGALAQSTQQGAPAMNLAGIGLTFNSNGIVAGTWGNTFTVPTTGLRMLGFGPTNLSVNNLSNTSAIYGRSGDPGASLSSFNGLALDISNSGVTTIVNNGSISVDLVQGATGSRANLPAVAVYGGGRADMTNNRQVTGRIGFAPSLQGNVFTNAGNIFGSVSMGAGSSNRFNMLTGSGVYVNDGNAGRLTASAGVEFAPSGIVDGGAGGNNTLSLQLAVTSGAPDSSTINTATYVNFNHFEVNSGTWSLRGQLASGGNTSVSLLGGALVVSNNAFAGSNTIDARGGTLRSEFGPLTLGNAIQLGRNLSTGGSGLTVDGVNSMTLNGLVSGGTDASLYKAGTGLLKLSGANSYAGGTTLSGGTLSVGNDLALGTGALTVAQASTLDSSALVALANDVVVNNHLTVDGSNQLRLDGTVSGAPGGGLVKTGTGTLMLARANSYSGGTTLSGGTLTVGNDLALGTGALTVAGASTLTSSAAVELANDVALNASLTVSGNNALGLNGTISGTAGAKLIKRGAGNLQLGGSNTFAGGVELNGGTLTVARAGALGSGPLVVSGNSRLAYQQSQALPGDVAINFPVTLELASDADLTSSGRIAGSGTLAKTGLGDLTLSGVTNIFTGTLDVRQGTLTMAAGSTLGSNPNLNVAAGATVRLNSAASVNNLSGAGTVWNLGALSAGIGNTSAVFDGQLRGSGSLTKVGSGTLTLNGSNGMTGKTEVNAGTLVLNGSLAAGPVTVKSGATLSGSGSTSGALTVEAGGKLGLKSGSTLRLGSLALNAGSSTNVTLGAPTTTPMAQVAGSLALNGTFNFTGTDALGNGVYRLFDYGGLLTSNLASIGALPEGITAGQLQLQTGVANQVNVVVNSPNLAMQFWDGNYSLANGVVNGGGGIWSAAGTNWTNASGSRNTAWAGDSAIFQGTGGGVEVEGSHDVKFMQFTGNGYQLVNGGAGQLNLVNADGGSAEVRVDADVTARIGVNMAGDGTLSKTSAGTLVLTGNNQYRGGTTLKAGRIVAHSDSALGTGALTASSGTALANQQSVSLGNSLQLAGDLTLDAGSTMTLGGAISGQGGLSKAGSGTLVLNGRNEMEGDFALNAGGVVIGNAQALGKGTLKTADGTSIDSRVPGVGVDNDVALTGALTVLGTRDLALTGTVSGNGNLIKAGGAALNLLGANTLDGSVTLAHGTLRLGTDTSLGNAALNVTGAATLQSAADIAVANRVRLDGNLTVVGGNALAFDGLLSGTAGLVKDGSGTLALGQANSYLGNTELKAGTLRLGNAGALSGGVLKATGSAALESTSSMNLANAVDISGSLTLQGSHDMTLSGAISGSGSLTKAGTGTLTLTGANTATGTTSVDAGRLLASAASLASGAITNNAALELMQQTDATLAQAIGGSGDLTKSGAGTLTLTGANTSTGGTAIIAGQLVASAANLGSGMLVNNAALELRQDTDATLAQDIAGSGDMVKSGSGTLTLTGANTSTGLTGITGGRLVASVANLASGDIVNNAALELRQDTAATLAQALGGSGDLIKSGTGTLTLAGTNTATGGTAIEAGRLVAGVAHLASGGITNNAALEIQQSDNAVLAQALGGSGELIKSGAGTLTLAGANTSTGGTTIDAGRLVASAANLGSGAITNNAALELKQASDATLAQAIGGSGELTKTGAGTLTLTGANTSTGGTRIVDGELVVSTANLGSGAIVNDAALQLKQDSNAVLAQDISGSGHLLKSGSGTLTLTGTNTSTGLTGIASGRLVASATNLASGAIINMAQLELNQAGEATLAQAISGSGQLIKSGTGTLTLTGSNTATGSTTIEAGRLVASVASLASGAIVNNAALEIRQSTNAVLAQAISGSGDLIKSGSAVLTLAGSNTSTGATTIEAGRLIASAANLGSGAITNHAALEIHQAQDATLAQAISGSGDLTKSGAGTLTLTGANTSTGGTAIIAGRVVASAATLGSGIIANNAALELKQESDATLAQAIAGSGELSKTGAGTLTLTGANTSTGATHIDAGRLVASSANLGSGTITNNAALELQQAADGTLTQAIAGSGGLTKTGAGTLTLTGRNSYAGDTLVSAGSLKFADADAQFSPGNTLAGNIQVAGGAGLEIATAATLSVGKAVELLQGAQLSIQSRGAQPSLVADSLQVGAEVGFNLSGIGARSELDRVLVSTNNGITGDFAKVHVGGFSGEVDYLTLTTGKSADGKQYLASYGLNWSANNNLAQGSFTLAGAGEQFDVGVALDDQGANGAAGWNGKTLSKKGAGTLVLSADNGYTGGTQIEAGTLQVGNGGMAGTLGTGSVANEGTLAFNRSNLLHVDNEISGSGNLVQKGTGTTVLLADNRYTGTTTIDAGTLQVGNGGTTGALGSGNVINNATLGINRSDAVTLSNAITGSGSLHQQGTGTTTLTGANDYRGGTTISAGRLIASSDSLGSGAITNHAALEVNQAGNGTLAQAISGTGDLTKSGAGTLTLTGANSSTGGTTIEAGRLIAGAGNLGSGTISNNAALELKQINDATLAQAIGGTGELIKSGAGTLTLTGTNTSTGGTTIEAGRLIAGAGNLGS